MIGQAWIQQMQQAAAQQAVYRRTGQFVPVSQAAEMQRATAESAKPGIAAAHQRMVAERRALSQRQRSELRPAPLPEWASPEFRRWVESIWNGYPWAPGVLSEEEYLRSDLPNPYLAARAAVARGLAAPVTDRLRDVIRRGSVAVPNIFEFRPGTLRFGTGDWSTATRWASGAREPSARYAAGKAFESAARAAGSEHVRWQTEESSILGRFQTEASGIAQRFGATLTRDLLPPMPSPAKAPDLFQSIRDRWIAECESYAKKIFDEAAPLRAVLERIPWPHAFFQNFAIVPPAETAAFFGQIPIWAWEDLWRAGYFRRNPDQIERDVAQWIRANSDALSKHFEAQALAWAEAMESQAKKKGTFLKIAGNVITIVGFAAAPFLGGLAKIALAAAQGAFTVARGLFAAGQQREIAEKAMKTFRITDEAMKRFAEWVSFQATRSTAGYVVAVEGRPAGTAATTAEASRIARERSRPGQRIEVRAADTQRQAALLVNVRGDLVPVDPDQRAAVMAAPPETVAAAAQSAKKEDGFPWALAAIAALALVSQ